MAAELARSQVRRGMMDAAKEEILEQAESKLKDMKKEKMEEMVEENSAAKPYRGVKR